MTNERRNFFRIEDEVLIHYQPVEESAVYNRQIPAQFCDDENYSLMNELQTVEYTANKFLAGLQDENPELVGYLKTLNKKIHLIASHIVSKHEQVQTQEKHIITFSEGGLAFHSKTAVPHDSFMAMQITLLPSHQTMVLFGKVINCSLIDNEYSVALSFMQVTDEERQIMAKHIMQKQLNERRQIKQEQ